MSMFGLPAALVVMTLAAPPTGRVPSPDEQKAFADGLRLFDAGDARGAERAWKAGYAVGHDPAFLVRIGEAEEKAGAPKEAVQSYEQYLRDSPDAADRADIENRIARLAPPAPNAKPGVDVEIPGEIAAPAALAPGATATPGAPATGPGVPPAAPPRRPQARDDGNEELRPIVDENQAPRSRLNTVAWAGAGVTALLLGVAAFYGASAADKAGDANRLLTYSDQDTGVPLEYGPNAQQFERNVRIGRRDDRIAQGFLITAGVTALATTALFIADSATGKKDPGLRSRADGKGRRPKVGPRHIPTGGGLALSWTF